MSKHKSISATPFGVLNQTQQQQHLNKQKRAPIGAINSANLIINFNQIIHNGQEKQYSIESEHCEGFNNWEEKSR